MAGEDLEMLAREGTIEKNPFPGFRTPMLATLTKHFFDDPQWIYERKLDGIRCVILIRDGKVSLYSRNENLLNPRFPELATRVSKITRHNLVADGEIVAFDGKNTSFRKLQQRRKADGTKTLSKTGTRVFLYIFDILYFNGYSLESLPLVRRKQLLKNNMEWADPIRYTPYRKEKGREYHQEACKKGWEGIIAKDGKAPYRHTRSREWLKFKCVNGQELVIAGFTEPNGGRIGFGALLVGFYEKGELKFAGKVGTGYSDEFLKEWSLNFQKIERSSSPFFDYSDDKNGRYHWVEPRYVGQFEFTEWTAGDKLRHPSFLGIREDKDPKEVVKEM